MIKKNLNDTKYYASLHQDDQTVHRIKILTYNNSHRNYTMKIDYAANADEFKETS